MSSKNLVVKLWKHQRQLIEAPFLYKDIEFFFLLGGYGCGKTTGDVDLLISLTKRYCDYPVVVGVGGSTITLLKKTLISSFISTLVSLGVTYSFDKQANTITVGRMSFQLIAMEQPELLYAYNFSIFIGDELDELPQDKAMAAFTASQERTRTMLPDGRKPFSVFTTTAQGYRGTYAIVEMLKERKMGYVLIRGKTKDNLALPREYVERLYALYDDNERKAFLEGYFVNLHTGRVYADYDPVVNSCSPFEVSPDEHIFVGQDLNAGFSKAADVIKKDGTLYIVNIHSFKSISNAPTTLRHSYPTQKITWYPDASSKEIMAGYTAEIRNANIELRIGNFNPSVVDRIFFVNKLCKLGKLKVFNTCKDLDIALKTRQFDDNGKPEKGKGEKAPDHFCDSLEYVVFRIVSSDPEFRALWQLARSTRHVKDVKEVAVEDV